MMMMRMKQALGIGKMVVVVFLPVAIDFSLHGRNNEPEPPQSHVGRSRTWKVVLLACLPRYCRLCLKTLRYFHFPCYDYHLPGKFRLGNSHGSRPTDEDPSNKILNSSPFVCFFVVLFRLLMIVILFLIIQEF